MGKVEITDEMARRAYDAIIDFDGTTMSVKRILEAALNEPEIQVTEEMLAAAQRAYCTAHQFNPKAKSWVRKEWCDRAHAAIYRAMAALDKSRKP